MTALITQILTQLPDLERKVNFKQNDDGIVSIVGFRSLIRWRSPGPELIRMLIVDPNQSSEPSYEYHHGASSSQHYITALSG